LTFNAACSTVSSIKTPFILDPAGGGVTNYTRSADGLTVNKSLSCGLDLDLKYDLDPGYKFKYVKERRETTPLALEKTTLMDKTYQDTNADDVPDLITETVSVNGKITTLENNVLQSQKTVTSSEGRTVTSLYDSATLLTTSLSVPGLFDTTYGYDETFEKCSILFKFKEDENFNHRNTLSILRIKI
jgi:hypothetical protein